MKREKLGSIWVDTARLLLGEPCVLLDTEDKKSPTYDDLSKLCFERDGEDVEKADEVLKRAEEADQKGVPGPTLEEMIEAMRNLTPPFKRSVNFVNAHGTTGAICVMCGTDGWYPVYLEYDADDHPNRIVIEIGKTQE